MASDQDDPIGRHSEDQRRWRPDRADTSGMPR
jgi:hypothetical protein